MTTDNYKQAVWEFMLEHCDITDGGSVFVKFHCDGRENFEKRIVARSKGYHREDIVEKEKLLIERKTAFEKERRLKQKKYKRSKKIRMIKRKIINLITLK